MDKSRIDSQYKKALELKKNEKYAEVLKAELAKPEWAQMLMELSKEMSSIESVKDYDRTMINLRDLFTRIYEKITAPGLDAFMGLIKDHTKNQNNFKELREFLMNDYEKYSNSIDAIMAAFDSIPNDDEKHLLDAMISDFSKKLKSNVADFMKDSSQFGNKIDAFLEGIKKEYEGLSEFPELSYTSIEQLYTDEQKADKNISFYKNIIKLAISGGQSLELVDEQEKDKLLCQRASNRIASIKKCIFVLRQTGIANSDDVELKSLFSRYESII